MQKATLGETARSVDDEFCELPRLRSEPNLPPVPGEYRSYSRILWAKRGGH
jgi:hypothetical protein